MLRYDIINHLISTYSFKNYLEIGVREPNDCFNQVNAAVKHSVDPCFEVEAQIDYRCTSDEFFALLESDEFDLPADYKWDIIFIDGLHISDQVERDILNALTHLSPTGIIVLHDCNPPTVYSAREDFADWSTQAGRYWNGTVWKAVYKFRATRPDLEICTVDTDWGVGIIRRGSQECCEFSNPFYEFNQFDKNRIYHLNLIQVEQFLQKYQ